MQEMYCLVSGKVQGVSYRVYAQDSATELGIAGWVRNLPDGVVELLAQADRDTLKDFAEYLHEGSLLAKVENVDIEWRDPIKLFEDFSILHD